MRICVVGAGFVGLATGVMLAKLGNEVTCVDIDSSRVSAINSGRSPFYEPPLEKELARQVRLGRLRATKELAGAASEARFVFICVQTPSKASGDIDIRPVKAACRNIGDALAGAKGYKVVVVKSTVVPTTTESVVKPMLEKASGKTAGKHFGLCVNPEFLREGFALKDSMKPSRIVVGAVDVRSRKALIDLYRPIRTDKIVTDLATAEMVKYASNAFLATKITYANEMANICARIGVDVEEVMKVVGKDPRIGPLFLKAGLGFGGSCLPKDVKALRSKAKRVGSNTLLLSALLETNERQPIEGVRMLEDALGDLKGKRVAVLGLAFKGGVDDVRDTRALPLIIELLAKGARVVAFDPMASKDFIKLMPTIEYAASALECLDGADGCIVQADWPEFSRLGRKEFSRMRNKVVVDGRRCLDPDKVRRAGATYLGIGYGRASI
jgi:UDPglucose 6-dehydrogenase